MGLLHKNISIVFKSAKPEHLNENESKPKLCFKKIDKSLYINYAREYNLNKSENELLQQYKLLENMIHNRTFFDLLSDFGEESIDLLNGIPYVKFDNIVNWRELSHKIGQSVIVTAYLAKKSLENKTELTYFAWPTTLKTNNRSLQNMLNSGTSENHYHLNGSSQIFPITWVCLMNNPDIISSRVDKLGKNLTPYISFGSEDNRKDWVSLLKEAARIRINLYCKIHNKYKNLIINEQLISSVELINSISTINFYDGYKSERCKGFLDYTLSKELSNLNFQNNVVLVGERKFLYDCFRQVFCDTFSHEDKNDFYKYLLIKHNFRAEIIQNNEYTGFQNFANYQDRKGFFIDGIEKYEREAIRTSLNDVFDQQAIVSLEARIMPRSDVSLLLKHINFYDETFGRREHYPYYFVLHYPKGISKIDKKEKDFSLQKPRNYKQRSRYKVCSISTMQALNCIPKLRERIFGIDACSNEIGCRPEVFATEYRYLKNCNFKNSNMQFACLNKNNIVLGRTYHVGEDFIDILDGLRAIDEVIKFLDFSYGDRIGHALALGINPTEYYNYKGNITVLPSQDALDNFVWLYNRSNEMNILIEPILKQKMESWIQELSIAIYGDFLDRIKDFSLKLDPVSLYNAWKLRGDNPELYRTMLCKENNLFREPYKNAMLKNDEQLNSLRKRKDISTLYYAYHFDYNVKVNGEKPYEFQILPEYIDLIEKIQNKLKFEVAEKGIMIECNPSSNCLIGTFKEYHKHPITSFNNLHLEINAPKVLKCPQISVSINTDDQGVFDTSLEYEYALIASALIGIKNDDGSPRYSPAQVYEYLDSVRKMGNVQSFRPIQG